MTTKELKIELRDGRYAWPGGYEKFYVTTDGGVLCDPCVRRELANVFRSTAYGEHDGWTIAGVDATCNADESDVQCDHCGTVIYDAAETTR